MKEWIVVASRSEAKIFERENKDQSMKWIKTLTNRKGRHRSREFESDKPGVSHAKFAGSCTPHNLEGENSHAEVVAKHFAHTIGELLNSGHDNGLYVKATVFAGPSLLGKIKNEIKNSNRDLKFIGKNIEKATADQIAAHL